MIHPAPTTRIDPAFARGILDSLTPATPTAAGMLVVSVPDTSYQLHLLADGDINAEVGKRIVGVITVTARRVDVVETGGKYVEPLFGRPRRVQGRVVSMQPDADTIVVDAGGVPITLKLSDDRQKPGDFAKGDLVSCDVMDGATFQQR